MKLISQYSGKPLNVVTASVWKRIYELKYSDEVIMTMRFPKRFISTAIVEGFGGRWTIKKENFWKKYLLIFKSGYQLPFSVYENTFLGRKGTLKLPRGNRFTFQFGLFKKSCCVFLAADVLLIEISNKIGLKEKAEINIVEQSETLSENPWVIMLAWYLILMNKKRAAHAG